MTTLRLPNKNVRPRDFTGAIGVCQNLYCLAPLEPPFIVASLKIPTGKLRTVLCCNCAPEKAEALVNVELVETPPVLELP
jgi:hypothetical protein